MEKHYDLFSALGTATFGKKVILFDGLCNLCDQSIQLIIKNDKHDVFRFVSLQSELGEAISAYLGIDRTKVDSIVLYNPAVAYYLKSQAVLEIAKELGGVFSLLSIFQLLPTKLTDSLYDYVAKNRYHWYGKKDHCLLPTPEIQAKFL